MASPRTVLVRGCGSIGARHLEALKARGHHAIAVPVRSERRAELAASGFDVADSVDDAVARGATAAIIATDTARHVRDAVEALSRGCHVLVEKPLAPSVADTEILEHEAEVAARRVFVAYCLRFHEGLELFRERLPEIGDVHRVRVECQSFLPSWRPQRDYRESYSARFDEGGVLRDLSHEIDYTIWTFGPPSDLRALISATSRLGIAAEEAVDLVWRTPRDAIVNVRLDYLTRKPRRVLLAQGSGGELAWDAIGGTVRIAPVDAAETIVRVEHDRDLMMQRQVDAFLAACNGEPDGRLCGLREGAFVVETCEEARRSSGASNRDADQESR